MTRIEDITKKDLAALAGLYEQLIDMKTDMDQMVKTFDRIAANPDHILLGAKDAAGSLVGSLMGLVCNDLVGECRSFMVLENMIVDAAARGRGVGRALIGRIEEIGRERGCRYVLLVSAQQRTAAHAFYESVGYPPGTVQGFKKYL